ncbi:MAG TPA: 1,6-anhydro-N-acetylmuramyl-L-alanine amidase AmpD [Gammaproteobacteria bacterium]|nr:1,6-anhydro-N-acetylmuramyl-L-alanine amidase AmpD [Gammaproteobacteria bacterium]
MRIDTTTGLCDDALFVPSPNCDSRPEGCSVDVVVLHSISLPPGQYHSPDSMAEHPVAQFFCNKLDTQAHPFYQEIKGLTVSAHFFISRAGSVVQFVPISARAWHAGESYCLQSTGVNNNSIGIELEGFDEGEDGYTPDQYDTLSNLLSAIKLAEPAIKGNIFAHSDIAPGRKTDPGPQFDWKKIKALLT